MNQNIYYLNYILLIKILIRERPLPQNFIDQLPVKPQKIENVSYSNNSLEQDLDDAWCVLFIIQ